MGEMGTAKHSWNTKEQKGTQKEGVMACLLWDHWGVSFETPMYDVS